MLMQIGEHLLGSVVEPTLGIVDAARGQQRRGPATLGRNQVTGAAAWMSRTTSGVLTQRVRRIP